MNEKEKMEKLLSLEVEKKMNERNAFKKVITNDQLVSHVAASSGIAEEKVRETMDLLSDELAVLYVEDRAKFIETLKLLTGVNEIDIIEDDC